MYLTLNKIRVEFQEGSTRYIERLVNTGVQVRIKLGEVNWTSTPEVHLGGSGSENRAYPYITEETESWSGAYSFRYPSRASLPSIISDVGDSAYNFSEENLFTAAFKTNLARVVDTVNLDCDENCVWMASDCGTVAYNDGTPAELHYINRYGSGGYFRYSTASSKWMTSSVFPAENDIIPYLNGCGTVTVLNPSTLDDGKYFGENAKFWTLIFNYYNQQHNYPRTWKSDNAPLYDTVNIQSRICSEQTIDPIAEDGSGGWSPYNVFLKTYSVYGNLLGNHDFFASDHWSEGNIYWNGVWHKDMYLNGHYHSSAYVRENGSWSKWWQHL